MLDRQRNNQILIPQVFCEPHPAWPGSAPANHPAGNLSAAQTRIRSLPKKILLDSQFRIVHLAADFHDEQRQGSARTFRLAKDMPVTLRTLRFDLTRNRSFPDACMSIEHFIGNSVKDEGVVT